MAGAGGAAAAAVVTDPQRAELQALYSTDPDVREACVTVRLDEEKFVAGAAREVTRLELVLLAPRSLGFIGAAFVNLTELCVIDAPLVDTMDGIAACTALQALWVCNTSVSRITALDGCAELAKVVLYANRIEAVEGLGGLKLLRHLDLHSNRLTSLKGIESTPLLELLSVADNQIESVAPLVDGGFHQLERLDLSGNRIGTLDHLLTLAALRSLRHLEVDSKDFGPNPAAGSLAYPAAVHTALPHLASLDSRDIAPKKLHRRLAATADDLCRAVEVRAKREETAAVGRLRARFDAAVAAVARVDNVAAACKRLVATPNVATESVAAALAEDVARLDQVLEATLAAATAPESEMILGRATEAVCGGLACQLEQLALGSHGDFRFSVGGGERWDGAVRAMFAAATAPLHWVVRVHSHQLSRALERAFLDWVAPVPPVPTPSKSGYGSWISRAPDDPNNRSVSTTSAGGGSTRRPSTRSASAKKRGSGGGAGPITSERLLFYCGRADGTRPVASLRPRDLVALAARGFDGCVGEEAAVFSPAEGRAWTEADAGVRAALLCRVVLVQPTQRPPPAVGASSVGAAGAAADQTGADPRSPLSAATSTEGVASTTAASTAATGGKGATFELRTDDAGAELLVLRDPSLALPNFVLVRGATARAEVTPLEVSDNTSRAVQHVAKQLQPFRGDVALPPVFYTSLARADHFDKITVLYLSGMGRRGFPSLHKMPGLVLVDASHNALADLGSFAGLQALRELVVSHNQLDTLADLTGLPALKKVSARCNRIDSGYDVGLTAEGCPALEELDLRLNPFARAHAIGDVRLVVQSRLPDATKVVLSATTFAYAGVSATAGVELAEGCGLVGGDLTAVMHSPWWVPPAAVAHLHRLPSPRSSAKVNPNQSGAGASTAREGGGGGGGAGGRGGHAVAVGLGRLGVAGVLDLGPRLSHLRYLVLAESGLSVVDLEPLRYCTVLAELCLAGNEVESCQFLHPAFASTLWRLDLDRNAVVDLTGLGFLPNLRVLSVQDNLVTSLRPLLGSGSTGGAGGSSSSGGSGEGATKLQHLYATGNQIENCRAVFPLRECRELRTIALARNPCASAPDYRVFVAFHLAQLETLDGAPLTSREERAGVSAYNGLLSTNVLVDEYGESELGRMPAICLAHRGFKSVDRLTSPTMRLHSLTNLDLSGNELDSLAMLHLLPALKVLALDENKIRRLGVPADETQLFPSLEVLSLASNMISDLQPLELSRLPQLHSLFLQSNLLGDTEGLRGLESLQHLVLDRNRVRTVTPNTLSSCPCLAEVYLVGNRLSVVDELVKIRGLERLHLSCNKLTQMEDVFRFGALERLVDVTFDHNPCCRDATFRAQLILALPRVCFIDRKEVTFVHRELAAQWQSEVFAAEAAASGQWSNGGVAMGMGGEGTAIQVGQVGPVLVLNAPRPEARDGHQARPTNSHGKRATAKNFGNFL